MIHILYQNDHLARAQALAAVNGCQSSEVNTPPRAIPNLDTLVFWGHGDILKLCTKTPAEIKQIVRDWKVLNGGLKTVEVITCNARHGTGTIEPYISKLKTALHGTSIMSKTRGMVLKSVPVNVQGSVGGYSILLADAPSSSYCYITAKSDTTGGDSYMMQAQWDLKLIAKSCGDNLAIAAPKLEAQYHGKPRNFTMNYGTFQTLRNLLSPIH